MLGQTRPVLHVAKEYQPIFRELAIDAEVVFDHPLIKPWRKLDDRENCTLDTTLRDGRHVRWHIKRYQPQRGITTPADDEIRGHRGLTVEQIPTAKLVGYGKLPDRRSFVVFEDLEGFTPADKWIEAGASFEKILQKTADLSAKLHGCGLHHRDLYLCHFLVKADQENVDVRLIDSARVKRLPGFLTRGRWIVKDLAQFWYSSTKLPITDDQRTAWLQRYGQERGLASIVPLRNRILKKVAWIAKHDAQLQRQQPNRNVSIPEERMKAEG
jgi:hypothetical protein